MLQGWGERVLTLGSYADIVPLSLAGLGAQRPRNEAFRGILEASVRGARGRCEGRCARRLAGVQRACRRLSMARRLGWCPPRICTNRNAPTTSPAASRQGVQRLAGCIQLFPPCGPGLAAFL